MKISIIIPVLNEAAVINHTIERARQTGPDEILFVDGGSSDATLELIEKAGCPLWQTERSRGRQLRVGARRASGDVLLLLHADNWLDPKALSQIRNCAVPLDRLWGGFGQKIDHPRPIYRSIEWGNHLRASWGRLLYGDQGIFVSRELHDRIGGLPELPLMEDFELSRRLARHAKPLMLPGPIHVSARRWETRGPIRQTLKNWSIAFRYRCGQSPERLAHTYRKHDR